MQVQYEEGFWDKMKDVAEQSGAVIHKPTCPYCKDRDRVMAMIPGHYLCRRCGAEWGE